MQITKEQLKAIMPNIEGNIAVNTNFSGYGLTSITDLLNKYASAFGINTPLRWAHYLAQIAVECSEFRYTSENLNYSSARLMVVFPKYFNATSARSYGKNPQKIANRVYANRMGNGSEASGDGYRFRGRGCIQLTGRSNYKEYNAYLAKCGIVVDLTKTPELIAKPVGAIKSSMYYWAKNGLNEIADRDDVLAVRKKVNGGTNGLAEVKEYLKRAKKVFKIV